MHATPCVVCTMQLACQHVRCGLSDYVCMAQRVSVCVCVQAVINEECGDGIMSAIDFYCNIDAVS